MKRTVMAVFIAVLCAFFTGCGEDVAETAFQSTEMTVCESETFTPADIPEPETTAPAPETTAPAPETTAPAPETTVPEPETTVPEPETTIPEPETTVPEPETTVPEPETTVPEPETTVPEPETTVPEPETTVPEPETTVPEPETTVPEPETTVPEPETTVPEPETTVPEPETTVPEPETTVSEPETTVPEPETTVPEPDYDELAENLIAACALRAKSIIDNDPHNGSLVTFPFEERCEYLNLSDIQLEMYIELRSAVENFRPYSFNERKGVYYDDFMTAARALYSDYPRLALYSRISEIKLHSRVLGVEVVYHRPGDENDLADPADGTVQSDLAFFDACCDYIVNSIPDGYSAYDKYRYIAAVVSYLTDYDELHNGGSVSENSFGAIVCGKAVCKGYARAFEYLCEKADLYCVFVSGANLAYDVHMWNLVKLDSGTYHVDVTWSDTTYGDTLGYGWMRYFMKTQSEAVLDHIIDDGTVATGVPLKH